MKLGFSLQLEICPESSLIYFLKCFWKAIFCCQNGGLLCRYFKNLKKTITLFLLYSLNEHWIKKLVAKVSKRPACCSQLAAKTLVAQTVRMLYIQQNTV